ncbi:hypothetical protein [Micromonospora zhanjiangensis]|uniref:Uncharacterized protein n=1 Tax=Micromonospora zhanjiangensis TaxID=1522057 RepID=A0ABV8KNZ4_9ACTN
MRTPPLDIDGLAGPLVVDTAPITGRHAISVGGEPTSGTPAGEYLLPLANGGLVTARLRRGVLDPYPRVEIDGVSHRTGPPVPTVLRALALLPLSLVLLSGLLGVVLGLAGLAGNLAVLRTAWPVAARAGLMLVVFAAAVAGYLGVARIVG